MCSCNPHVKVSYELLPRRNYFGPRRTKLLAAGPASANKPFKRRLPFEMRSRGNE